MNTPPDAATFKARHVRFAALADATVNAYLAEAGQIAGQSWGEADYRNAAMNLAAHLMVEEGALDAAGGDTGAPNTTGPVQKIKAGDVETTFDVVAARMSGDEGNTYGSTVYGRAFLTIQRRYTSGGVFVV